MEGLGSDFNAGPFWVKALMHPQFVGTRLCHCWVDRGCMSVPAVWVPSEEAEGTETLIGALAAIGAAFACGAAIIAVVCKSRCGRGNKSPIKQTKLPSGLVVSYGGPSAK